MRVGTKSVLFGCDLNHIFAVWQCYGLFGCGLVRSSPLGRWLQTPKVSLPCCASISTLGLTLIAAIGIWNSIPSHFQLLGARHRSFPMPKLPLELPMSCGNSSVNLREVAIRDVLGDAESRMYLFQRRRSVFTQHCI
jgi:hypothetical protein